MVSDFRTSFISEALKSRRADSPGPSFPERSKNPTPCLYSTTCLTGSSAAAARAAIASGKTSMRFMISPFSLAHHFNDDAFGALSVEFGVINLLPRAEVELAFGHRNHHLMMHQQALQVRIAVGFAGAVMAVVLAERRQFFEPFVDIGDQPVFRVVDIHARSDMHGGYQNHALLDAALAQGAFHLRSHVDVLPVFRRLESEILRIEPHTAIIQLLGYGSRHHTNPAGRR